MAKSNNQKAKILYLERMLYGTGENRTVTMQEILAGLEEKGIRAERKSVYDDLEVLRSVGMDIRYRRERPGGYYLVGQNAVEKSAKEAAPVNIQEKSSADKEAWKSQKTSGQDSKKQMKLLCDNTIRKEVTAYFGDDAEYKEKGQGFFTVTTQLLDGAQFYGWLTAMGEKIHILKPKKAAQTYRDYLKTLAKEYKGV